MRKVIVPKKKPLRKISALIRDADMWFSRWVRLRDQKNGYCACVSCGNSIFWREMSNCHFIRRSNYYWRRDPRNCRSGCTGCNMYNIDFHIRNYTIKMIKEHGMEFVESMQEQHQEQRHVKRDRLMSIIEKYKNLVRLHPLFQDKVLIKKTKIQQQEYDAQLAKLEELYFIP